MWQKKQILSPMNIHDCIYFHGTCIRYVLCFVACYTLNAEIFKVFVREYYNVDNSQFIPWLIQLFVLELKIIVCINLSFYDHATNCNEYLNGSLLTFIW